MTISRCFGDPPVKCTDESALACDVCDDGEPYWYDVPLDRVPDPEQLVDTELVTLQAVRWACRYRTGRYGEVSLKAAICGRETLGPNLPISPGLLSCPQFGALRYLHGAGHKVDEAVDSLIDKGFLTRVNATHAGRSYSALELTDAGSAAVGGPRG
jgi:ATP-dependent DNA helicase RecQ